MINAHFQHKFVIMKTLSGIQYCALGAVEGIGASAHYLKFDRWGILLDSGLDPHLPPSEGMPEFDLIKSDPVDAIIITHAHFDHIGSLPVAIQNFSQARVYMTPATMELTEKMLFHALQLQRRLGNSNATQLYDETFLDTIHYLYQTFDYLKPFPLHGKEESQLRFTFYDAGHILGSAGILIEWKGKRIFYTGNTRKSSQFILKGARYPEPPIDILISEATYGADPIAESIHRKTEIRRFAKRLSQHLQWGGIVLLPVFALGRTQEMIMLIHQLRLKNQIPVVPVYLGGLGLRINQIYDRLLHKVYPEYNHGTIRSMVFDRWDLSKKIQGPAILISTSGMMYQGSPSFEYARELVSSPRNAIFFVGYADPETPAGLFREQRIEALTQLLQVERIACAVEIFHFSAHSHRRELLAMVKKMKPKKVIYVHGDAPALKWMLEETQKMLPDSEVIIPPHGKRIDLLPSPGGRSLC
ncbi:MAG: MBL fold metallo-hydrolase [Calditrichaeota bacterium]|nr:MAG: MBL fold metallo-hydrolase [Calditrichota bacterium]